MTFYEQELRKIVGEQYPDVTYVGRACYVRLSDINRAKIQFVTGIVANQYNALQMTILNRSEGQVDTLRLRFSDLLGTKATSNPNFRNGVDPHIWESRLVCVSPHPAGLREALPRSIGLSGGISGHESVCRPAMGTDNVNRA